jgi:hypothetical protein
MNQRDRKADSGLSGLATLPFSWNLQPNFVGLGEGRDHCCCVHTRFLGEENEMKMLFIKPYSKMYLKLYFQNKKAKLLLAFLKLHLTDLRNQNSVIVYH